MQIELHRAAWDRGTKEYLLPADLTLSPGERLVILGGAGSGGGLLLSLIAGGLQPTEGMVRFTSGGKEMTRREVRQSVCMIPRSGGLWDPLTLWENVETLCRLYGMGRERTQLECERALDRCGLGRGEDIPFGKLPPDWRKMGAAAAAMACGAALVCAEDLTWGLTERECLRLAGVLRPSPESGTVFVTHMEDPARAEASGRRFLLLGQGRILFDGSGAEVLRAGRSARFADAAERILREAEG